MTSREENVLTARDPSVEDENDWPEFTLLDVRILQPGRSRYANLLFASPESPVQVTGRLDEVDEGQESLVLDKDYLTKRLVIDNATHYAYGQHDDGEIGIWVAGRAGWFSISPAKGYRPMFNEMVEAIDLLYFLADKQTRRSRRRNRSSGVQYMLEEYVDHTHGICEDADDAAEVFDKHHNFLLLRMLKGGDGVNWIDTSIFEYLSQKFPEDYERIKAALELKTQDDANEDNEDAKPNGNSEETSNLADPETITKTHAETIFQVIESLKEEGYLAKRQLNIALVTSTMVDRYELDSPESARGLITARARDITKMMDSTKTADFDWSRKAIYRELKSLSKQGRSQELALIPLRPRVPRHGTPSSNEDEDEDEEEEKKEKEAKTNIEPNPKGRRRRVRKSVLRPKSSVSSKRFSKGPNNAPADQENAPNDDSSSETDVNGFETPSKSRGLELARDPLSNRTRRRTHSILSDPEFDAATAATPPPKKPLQEILQTKNTPMSTGTGDRDTSEPIATGDSNPNNDTHPPDTWICQVPGCGETVHKSSTKKSQEAIRKHTQAHADDTQQKVDLVFAEQRLNYNLPVGNLVGRIRQFGALDFGHDLGSGPDPSGSGNEASKRVRL